MRFKLDWQARIVFCLFFGTAVRVEWREEFSLNMPKFSVSPYCCYCSHRALRTAGGNFITSGTNAHLE